MTSEAALFRSVCSSQTFSKPTFINPPAAIMRFKIAMGSNSGMSMFKIRWKTDAPSIFAAS